MIALLAVSIKDVDNDEFAVAYHTITRHLHSEVLQEGRHYLLPGEKLFSFDSNVITRSHDDVSCVSKEGLDISFKIDVQFRLNPEDAVTILYEHGGQGSLLEVVDSLILDSALDSCATFTGEDFFESRGLVESDLASNITFTLTHANVHLTPLFVQLKNIGLPSAFQNAIKQARVALEDRDVAINERPGQLIGAQTHFLNAEQDANIVILDATAVAQGIQNKATAAGQVRHTTWSERTSAVQNALTSFNMTAADYATNVFSAQLLALSTSPVTQACLQTCTGNDCWFCWVGGSTTTVSPAV
jgi:regulator of protease activity HflC (stomatin/prohibitin superfamily)